MKGTTKVEFEVGGKTMTLETGLLARQADGSVTCGIGANVVFSAVTSAKEAKEGVDFFPLQVEYREKFYAAGRFRAATSSARPVLPRRKSSPCALRTVRSVRCSRTTSIAKYRSTTCSSVATARWIPTFSASNAASTALTLTDLPFDGPIGAVRIVRNDGEWIINPTHEQLEASDIDLTYCGSRDKVMMIEGSAKEIPEAEFIEAMKTAHVEVVKIIDGQLELRKALGMPEKVYSPEPKDTTLLDKARELVGEKFKELMKIGGKLERQDAVSALKEELKPQMEELFPEMTEDQYFHAFHDLEVETVRKNVIEAERVSAAAACSKSAISTARLVFSRICTVRLFSGVVKPRLCVRLHWVPRRKHSVSMPSPAALTKRTLSCTTTFRPIRWVSVRRLGMTSRREIGHGNLAERSIGPGYAEGFPVHRARCIRSHGLQVGSSSMGSACGGCLALMDAGVPLTAPVAGISVGLFTDDKGASIEVIDILGVEDHCGDMDFKGGRYPQGDHRFPG